MGLTRRCAAYAVAALLGTLAATAVGAPARAASWTISASARCDTASHLFVISWNITNYESFELDLTSARSNAVPSGTSTLTYVTPGGESSLPGRIPIAGGTIAEQAAMAPGHAVILQRVPGNSTQASVSFIASYLGGNNNFVINGNQSLTADCVAAAVVAPPTTAATSSANNRGTPDAAFTSACDGTVVVTLTNPGTGGKSLTFTLEAGDGAFTRSETVAARQSTTVTVPADRANGIRVRATGLDRGPYSWAKPETCSASPASAAPSAGAAQGWGPAGRRSQVPAAAGAGPAQTMLERNRVAGGIVLLVLAGLAAILFTVLLRHYRRSYRPVPPPVAPRPARPVSGAGYPGLSDSRSIVLGQDAAEDDRSGAPPTGRDRSGALPARPDHSGALPTGRDRSGAISARPDHSGALPTGRDRSGALPARPDPSGPISVGAGTRGRPATSDDPVLPRRIPLAALPAFDIRLERQPDERPERGHPANDRPERGPLADDRPERGPLANDRPEHGPLANDHPEHGRPGAARAGSPEPDSLAGLLPPIGRPVGRQPAIRPAIPQPNS